MKRNKQLELILLHLIRPAVAAVLALMAVNFVGGQMTATSKLIQEKRTAHAILEKPTESVENIKKDFARVPEDAVERMESVFPPADNIIEFIVALEGLASRLSVGQFPNFGTPAPFIQKGEGNSAVDISSISLTLNLTANAANIIRYLDALEEFPFLTSISEIHITSNGAKGWESTAAVSVKGAFYTKTIK